MFDLISEMSNYAFPLSLGLTHSEPFVVEQIHQKPHFSEAWNFERYRQTHTP